MGKSTISMAIFNSYVSLPEGTKVDKGSQRLHPFLADWEQDFHYEWWTR
jgi:hypothetical protein